MNGNLYESVTTTYQIGGYQSLTDLWRDKNVFCPNNKLYYVTDGEIEVKTKQGVFIAKKGDMVLIPAGTKHDFNLTNLKHGVKYWVHFDMKISGTNFFENFNLPYLVHVGIDDYPIFLFNTLIKRAKGKLPSDKLTADAMVSALAGFYLDKVNYVENFNQTDEIDTVITHVKNNYSEKFTLNELSRIANLSPNYFVRKFKERTGYPPLKYVTVLKLERAKVMLEQSTQPIGEIMEELGFLDSAHFSKLFKLSCGHSPRRYRDIYKNRTSNA